MHFRAKRRVYFFISSSINNPSIPLDHGFSPYNGVDNDPCCVPPTAKSFDLSRVTSALGESSGLGGMRDACNQPCKQTKQRDHHTPYTPLKGILHESIAQTSHSRDPQVPFLVLNHRCGAPGSSMTEAGGMRSRIAVMILVTCCRGLCSRR